MEKRYYKCILTAYISILSATCFAQNSPADSVSAQGVVANTASNFYISIGDQSRLYNGPEFVFYDPLIKGNPYFNDVTKFETGNVKYDGVEYNGVPIMYDQNKDCVVTLLSNKTNMIRLLSERVQSFDVLSHHFIYLNLPGNTGLTPGFYDQLYNGQIELLVKRRKTIQKTSAISGAIESYFNARKDIYIKKNGVYKSVSGKGAMLSILKDKKKELKQYIRSSAISFDENQEQAMVKVAAYYDQITK